MLAKVWPKNVGKAWEKNDKELSKLDFPGGALVENLPANAGDMGSSPGPGRYHMPQST